MTRKRKYLNKRTGEIRKIEVEIDDSGHASMFLYIDGDEWKAVPKWSLKVVNSSEFFRSAHENTVKFKSPPLDGSDMPYGLT